MHTLDTYMDEPVECEVGSYIHGFIHDHIGCEVGSYIHTWIAYMNTIECEGR
jgi:hypothetical protein